MPAFSPLTRPGFGRYAPVAAGVYEAVARPTPPIQPAQPPPVAMPTPPHAQYPMATARTAAQPTAPTLPTNIVEERIMEVEEGAARAVEIQPPTPPPVTVPNPPPPPSLPVANPPPPRVEVPPIATVGPTPTPITHPPPAPTPPVAYQPPTLPRPIVYAPPIAAVQAPRAIMRNLPTPPRPAFTPRFTNIRWVEFAPMRGLAILGAPPAPTGVGLGPVRWVGPRFVENIQVAVPQPGRIIQVFEQATGRLGNVLRAASSRIHAPPPPPGLGG